ncbi:MAG: trehalase [Gammaproteobacteria bacterium]|nr:trehalase [Gammaproteobacteria bacterium]
MSLSIRILLVLLLASSTGATSVANVPDSSRTLAYIHRAWGTLTRSSTDCASYRGPYVRGKQVLYLPKDLPEPPAVADLKQCGVEVLRLPARIRRLGDFQPATLGQQGYLYLPHSYVVPGGFFNEMFGWDSYFIELGLIADHRDALARDMVANMLFEVANYGGVLNANATYFLTRSQPPLLGEMIRALLSDKNAFPDQRAAAAWLRQAYPLAVENYSIWQRDEHRAGNTGLSRYFDYGGSEPAVRGGYARQVIRFLLAHPGENDGYLIKASQHPTAAEAARLAKVSCDVHASQACADGWYEGYRLTAKFYGGDRAMRESGFDVSFRFGPFSGSTTEYAPVCLNSLLYRYALDLQRFAQRLGLATDATRWAQDAAARKRAINTYLWNPALGLYTDYDFVTGKPSYYAFITAYYPLWAGIASKLQAQAVREKLPLFERVGGLQTSTYASGAQWDSPFGWAPTNWLAVSGLEAYGYDVDARRIASEFMATVDRGLADDGTIREKYNMATGNSDVKIKITAGYTQNVIGFGWTNGIYLKFEQLLSRH